MVDAKWVLVWSILSLISFAFLHIELKQDLRFRLHICIKNDDIKNWIDFRVIVKYWVINPPLPPYITEKKEKVKGLLLRCEGILSSYAYLIEQSQFKLWNFMVKQHFGDSNAKLKEKHFVLSLPDNQGKVYLNEKSMILKQLFLMLQRQVPALCRWIGFFP